MIFLDFDDFKSIDRSFGSRAHNNRNFKFSMSTNEIGMVVSEDNIFQSSTSFFEEFLVGQVVIGWVDDVGLCIGLDIVGEDGKHFGFELGDIDAFFLEFRDELDVGSHEIGCIGYIDSIGKFIYHKSWIVLIG